MEGIFFKVNTSLQRISDYFVLFSDTRSSPIRCDVVFRGTYRA